VSWSPCSYSGGVSGQPGAFHCASLPYVYSGCKDTYDSAEHSLTEPHPRFAVDGNSPQLKEVAGIPPILRPLPDLGDMRITLIIISVLLLLIGAVWILQGINILPGSFMTGEIRWAYAGIVTALTGGGVLWIALRVKRR